MTRVCSIAGCDSPHDARGWCNRHYTRWLRRGTTDLVPRSPFVEGPLVCVCPHPQPDAIDMCATCLRVVAELVIARRATADRSAA